MNKIKKLFLQLCKGEERFMSKGHFTYGLKKIKESV